MRVDGEANRRRLLLAARDAVAEQGPGVGVRAIADRAELGLTTLYRHFPDKQALIDGVSVHRWSTMLRLAHGHASAGRSFAAVAALLETFSRMVTVDDDFILSAGLVVGRTPEPIVPVRARYDQLLRLLWATGQDREEIRGGIDPRDAMELAGAIRDASCSNGKLVMLLNGIATEHVDVAPVAGEVRRRYGDRVR